MSVSSVTAINQKAHIVSYTELVLALVYTVFPKEDVLLHASVNNLSFKTNATNMHVMADR